MLPSESEKRYSFDRPEKDTLSTGRVTTAFELKGFWIKNGLRDWVVCASRQAPEGIKNRSRR